MPHPEQTYVGTTLPLVLLPGTLCDARVFAPLRQRLAPLETRVLLTCEARSLEEAAEMVLLQAPQRFVLLGFSLGGMVALEAIMQAPERVCGVALLSTTPLPVAPERQRSRRDMVQAARAMPMRRFLRERLWPEYGGATDNLCTLPMLETMAEELGYDTFALQTEMALQRPDLRPRLHAITCPSVVIAGTADSLCPPQAQQSLLAGLPHSAYVPISGAGHFALTEQPDEVAAAVAAWFHTLKAAEHGAGDTSARCNKAQEKQ